MTGRSASTARMALLATSSRLRPQASFRRSLAAPREHVPRLVGHVHDIIQPEVALHGANAHGKERLAAHHQSIAGPLVHDDGAVHGVPERDPQFLGRDLVGAIRRREQRADCLSGSSLSDAVRAPPLADDHGDACGHEHPGRLDLRDHAAASHAGHRAPGRSQNVAADAIHDGNERGRRIDLRVRRVQPVDIREDHHEVGVDEAGHERRQGIVVAEADLLDGHRVVLVHDGHHGQLQKPVKRIPRVQVGRAVRRVAPGEQHHARQHVPRPEGLGIGRGKGALPHGGRRLQARHVRRALGDAQCLQAAGNGRRRDDDHVPSGRANPRHLIGQIVQKPVVDGTLGGGEGGRADLHHQALAPVRRVTHQISSSW